MDLNEYLMKQCETLEAEVQRLRDALEAIKGLHIVPPLMTEQARQLMAVQDIARKALEGGE